jgi:hypothetical protein
MVLAAALEPWPKVTLSASAMEVFNAYSGSAGIRDGGKKARDWSGIYVGEERERDRERERQRQGAAWNWTDMCTPSLDLATPMSHLDSRAQASNSSSFKLLDLYKARGTFTSRQPRHEFVYSLQTAIATRPHPRFPPAAGSVHHAAA